MTPRSVWQSLLIPLFVVPSAALARITLELPPNLAGLLTTATAEATHGAPYRQPPANAYQRLRANHPDQPERRTWNHATPASALRLALGQDVDLRFAYHRLAIDHAFLDAGSISLDMRF